MRKLLAFLTLGLGVMVLAGSSEAASPSRGAKAVVNINYSTTVSTVSVAGPAVLYSVILSTGTAGTNYTNLWDLSAVGATALDTVAGLKAKVTVSSTTQNTVINFDPPLQFQNGIVAANSVATTWSAFVYERGRVTQGY